MGCEPGCGPSGGQETIDTVLQFVEVWVLAQVEDGRMRWAWPKWLRVLFCYQFFVVGNSNSKRIFLSCLYPICLIKENVSHKGLPNII